MNIQDIKQTAFAQWLLLQSREEARDHLWECLVRRGAHNSAWDLWNIVHGDSKVMPAKLTTALDKMLDALEGKKWKR